MTTREDMRRLLRGDFHSFMRRVFHEVSPQAGFLDNWHLEVMAAKLDAVSRGKITRLIINVPPRSLKSICASVALPAWCLGHDPGRQIICASYAQDLSDTFARQCRSVMTASWFKDLFPTRLSRRRQAVAEFETTRGGFRLATSVGGVLTGRGGDLIIIDDPLKPDEAASDSERRAVNEWYGSTAFSRLNDKLRGGIVLIMQRVHEDDLTGHLLEQGGWEHLSFAAVAEADEAHEVDTIAGRMRFVRKAGEALHPDRESIEALEMIRRNVGTYNFASQYQQAPAPLGGGMVKREWFVLHDAASWPTRFQQIYQSWDTANTVGELSDYSVCTTWGTIGGHNYLLDVFRRKLTFPELKRAVVEHKRLHRAQMVIIEDRASGTQLIQELVASGVHATVRYRPMADKTMRMYGQTATIENGFVHLPRSAPWLDAYLHELTIFPRGRHDDQADSTSQFLDWLSNRFVGPVAASGTFALVG